MKPLVVTDCDEVLLHFSRHFRDWLAEAHGIEFRLANGFAEALVDTSSGRPLPAGSAWDYLHRFFDTEMARQTAIEGAAAAIAELQREADVVVLTNLLNRFNPGRRAQLRTHGIDVPVFTNQGPKGDALRRIVADYAPARAVFIDDLAQHHASAADLAPAVTRLHLCGDPELALHVPCALRAGHAHARIDTWAEAVPWLLDRLHGDPR